MNGPECIQPTQMEAWLRLNDIQLEPWEVTLIERLDIVLLSAIQDKEK